MKEARQQKVLHYVIAFVWNTGIDHFIETECRLVVARGRGEEGMEKNYFNGWGVLLWRNGNVLNKVEVVVAQHSEWTKCHWISHFKIILWFVNFTSLTFFFKEWSIKCRRIVAKDDVNRIAIIILSAQIVVEICDATFFFHAFYWLLKNLSNLGFSGGGL